MRALIGLVLVVVILAAIGWIRFHDDSSKASLTVDKQEIAEDMSDLSEAADQVRQDVEAKLEEDPQ